MSNEDEVIEPTIGRVLWYHPHGFKEGDQPWPCLVCKVINSREVNVAGFEATGHAFSALSVQLLQGNEHPRTTEYCEWMPFQKAASKAYEPGKGLTPATGTMKKV